MKLSHYKTRQQTYLYEYSGIPDADTMLLLFLKPSSQKEVPFRPDLTGDSGPKVESDRIVQESKPFWRIGTAAALRELLLPICDRFRWYLRQNNAEIAKATPITTPIEIPMISPVDSSFISPLSSSALEFPIDHPIHWYTCHIKQQNIVKYLPLVID